ncbi:TspO and MBR related proteins [Actinomadura meyerae]|uniref:TspO and MBR related proteins n=1 Tax=Actinomadura meyerae TaxID=240840 RepID=A0A239N9Z4_9ACTN|nr:TspO/MBR family protein [Actinomadura meyerae]SNT51580.1 TspO and MBR related proteins [Actinomadura meyerae]
MKPTKRPRRRSAAEARLTYAATAAATAAAAAIGSKAVNANTVWYRSLSKPAWQPPSWAFGLVWTPLYASIAWAGGHALLRAGGRRHRELAAGLGVNLALNAAWNQLFFGRRSTKAGLVGTVLLDLSNADLIRRTAAVDTAAAGALVPYAAWCAFATALNADIARRNR